MTRRGVKTNMTINLAKGRELDYEMGNVKAKTMFSGSLNGLDGNQNSDCAENVDATSNQTKEEENKTREHQIDNPGFGCFGVRG